MKVIAVASQKGGTGKTTISAHLAVQAELFGAGPVALIDTDPQGSLSNWWNVREAGTPVFVRTTIHTLSDDLAQLREAGVKLVIIDTPPAISEAIVGVVEVSGLAVIPVRPSPHDLAAAGATVGLIESQNKPLIFVINSASPRARITGEAAIALSQHGTVAPSIIHHRTEFASSMIDGRTVMELPRTQRSSAEIETLWSYLDARLERIPDFMVLPTGHMTVDIERRLQAQWGAAE
ncbi:MAG: ParA family protein [Rhodospirillales bacterium]|nr:ParA family protein [Rhodospirillales bacterium]